MNDAALVGARLSIAATALRLTPARERLIFAIASGLTLETAAERQGVRLNKTRTQLQRNYDKVGIRSQAALMHALLAASP